MITKPRLFIISGIPGSGKTTLARKLKRHIELYYHNPGKVTHYEADMFFTDESGNYNFNPYALQEAHEWCQNMVKESVCSGYYTIVANTFLKPEWRKFYFDLARKYTTPVKFFHCTGEFNNVHGVPADRVEKMKSEWVDITGKEIEGITFIYKEI